MNLAAVFRNVGITKCVPEGALCKHVTQMAIAPLDSTVATAGNAQQGQVTREKEVKVKVKMKLVGES